MNKWSIILALFVVVTPALGETPASSSPKVSEGLSASAEEIVQSKFLDPLTQKEANRSRFSRARLPPSLRRVRILDRVAQTDAQGHAFVRFAIDELRGFAKASDEDVKTNWQKDAMSGCVYPETQQILIKRDKVYYDSSMLIGTKTSAAPDDACRSR